MGTPERSRESMAKWRKWIDDMNAKGCLKNLGLPLERTGGVLRGTNRDVVDGPYAETKEVVGGFSVIEASDLKHAQEIASGCPILDGGGSVEVRPVMAMTG
jgi:hypothetical protein